MTLGRSPEGSPWGDGPADGPPVLDRGVAEYPRRVSEDATVLLEPVSLR